ncbi:hypothetical protein Slin15195_G106700 [Septoria linicola]|uniref:Uncharacterized protein n=1 Tax=Septoria linicola TaxID=215465 RepID=A0A9Q9B561_9PEZI|nr:hypothetical protein Slin14017_G069670 [Septoria linicola]USW57351.1 hypothetical protein Slin15195_G106700 [Septoria linicola]
MLQYCYQSSYGSGIGLVPGFHVEVYAIAEKYLVAGLAHLASEQLAQALENASKSVIAAAISKAYTMTLDPSRSLRAYLLDVALEHCDELLTGRCSEFDQLLSNVPAFAADLVPVLARSRYHVYHSFYDQPIYRPGAGSLFFLSLSIGRRNTCMSWIMKLAVLLNDAIVRGGIQRAGSFHYSPVADDMLRFEESHRHIAGPQLYYKFWVQSVQNREKWANSTLEENLDHSSIFTKQWGSNNPNHPIILIWTAESTFSGIEGALQIAHLYEPSAGDVSIVRPFEQWPTGPGLDQGCLAHASIFYRIMYGLASEFYDRATLELDGKKVIDYSSEANRAWTLERVIDSTTDPVATLIENTQGMVKDSGVSRDTFQAIALAEALSLGAKLKLKLRPGITTAETDVCTTSKIRQACAQQ